MATNLRRKSLLIAAIVAAIAAGHAGAAEPRADVKGAQDHPLVKRFAGSWLAGYRAESFAQTEFPASSKTSSGTLVGGVKAEGRITHLHYIAPLGKTPLEVHRNYEQALVAAGLNKQFACDLKDCDVLGLVIPVNSSEVAWASGDLPFADGSGSRYALTSARSIDEPHALYGTIDKGGTLLHVWVYTSVAGVKATHLAYTYLRIAEPKAMASGQVTVDTAAMKSGLDSDGKIALYGLFFDTGQATIKPESKPQLDEMAKLLQSQPGLKVMIVGHTDNVGALASNLTLSQQRADAVVQALAGTYKVDAKRMLARGVANFAPVASNVAEAGRAKNRRVEMVLQ